MSYDIFLKIDGIDGESMDDKHCFDFKGIYSVYCFDFKGIYSE
ncbi:hypothetical protein LTSEGIV_0431 [Salmonella enterica subsp. enterica serovar Give str. S5-487]|nr:hypothetical protein LTSEGIV_0431 [Salmonella enterica subsp. enterica serovar Give str. S5-487]